MKKNNLESLNCYSSNTMWIFSIKFKGIIFHSPSSYFNYSQRIMYNMILSLTVIPKYFDKSTGVVLHSVDSYRDIMIGFDTSFPVSRYLRNSPFGLRRWTWLFIQSVTMEVTHYISWIKFKCLVSALRLVYRP